MEAKDGWYWDARTGFGSTLFRKAVDWDTDVHNKYRTELLERRLDTNDPNYLPCTFPADTKSIWKTLFTRSNLYNPKAYNPESWAILDPRNVFPKDAAAQEAADACPTKESEATKVRLAEEAAAAAKAKADADAKALKDAEDAKVAKALADAEAAAKAKKEADDLKAKQEADDKAARE